MNNSEIAIIKIDAVEGRGEKQPDKHPGKSVEVAKRSSEEYEARIERDAKTVGETLNSLEVALSEFVAPGDEMKKGDNLLSADSLKKVAEELKAELGNKFQNFQKEVQLFLDHPKEGSFMLAHNVRQKLGTMERLATSQPEIVSILLSEMIKHISLEAVASNSAQNKATDVARDMAKRLPVLKNISKMMGTQVQAALSCLDALGWLS